MYCIFKVRVLGYTSRRDSTEWVTHRCPPQVDTGCLSHHSIRHICFVPIPTFPFHQNLASFSYRPYWKPCPILYLIYTKPSQWVVGFNITYGPYFKKCVCRKDNSVVSHSWSLKLNSWDRLSLTVALCMTLELGASLCLHPQMKGLWASKVTF